MATYTIENKPWTENDLKTYYNAAKAKFPLCRLFS